MFSDLSIVNKNTIKQPTDNVPTRSCTLVPSWYVLRYRVLTNNLKKNLTQSQLEIFHPFSLNRCLTQEKTISCSERPLLPGYIFVHAPYVETLSLARELGLNMWRKPARLRILTAGENDYEFYMISHEAMLQFMKAVECREEGIQLYNATDIDLEQDDEVEFVSGPLKGQRGFVHTERRKAGGIVIVPLSSPDSSNGQALLHFGICAKAEEYRIVKFASLARNKDSIKRANENVKMLLSAYVKGQEISDKDKKRLVAYALRYSDTEMHTHIQLANLMLLMYRIYTILNDTQRLEQIYGRICGEVIAGYDKRMEAARGGRKEDIARQKKAFEAELNHLNALRVQRQV